MAPNRERNPRKEKHVYDDYSAPLLPTLLSEGVAEFNGASFTGAVFNLSTTTVGAGIMALPATMKVLGLAFGIVLIISMAILTEKSIDLLLKFSRAGRAASYGGIMDDTFGNVGRIFLQISVFVNNIGVLIVYMIIIGDVLSGTSADGTHHAGVLESWFGSHWWNERISILLFTILFVFAPLTCFKRIDSLRYTSAVSVGLAVVFLVIMAGIAIAKFMTGTVTVPRMLPDITDMNSFWKLFTVGPILVNAYICHYNVHSIDNELEDESQIRSVVQTSLALCVSVYVMTSLFGFLLFGDGTLEDVLANFDTDLGIPYGKVLNDAVRVSYAAHLMLVFPIVFYPMRANMDGLLFPSSPPLIFDNTRFAVLTALLMALIFIGATSIPSIWDAFQFTGATAAVCVGFIFPASIILKDRYSIATTNERLFAMLLIGLAVFSNVVAIYSDIYEVVDN